MRGTPVRLCIDGEAGDMQMVGSERKGGEVWHHRVQNRWNVK